MTSLRYRLERELWRQGVRVALLPGQNSPQVTRYPLLMPDGVTSDDVDKVLSQVSGRLSLGGLRGVWQQDGLYGLEVARQDRATINFVDMPVSDGAQVPWLLGVSTSGQILTVDLAKAPHLLIAGTTGSGKSNHVAGALASIVSNKSPDNVRLVLIDPKQVDLLSFADTPHCLTHTTKQDTFPDVLGALTDEMQRRYSLFKAAKVRDLASYNAKGNVLPRIVCVFDESATAISANTKVLTPLVMTLLQTARASGIHLVLAMQRPNGEVLTPTARLNLPLRISFRVLDANSSRLVLDSPDAASLLGNGDGLLLSGDGALTRFQSPLVTDKDLAQATQHAQSYPSPAYTLGGLTSDTNTFTLDPSLSPFEQAVMLLQGREWINASDLVKAGIVGSGTAGRYLLSELRDAGLVGVNNPSKRASPVYQSDGQPSQVDTRVLGKVTGKKPVGDASDAFDRQFMTRVRTVN